MTEWVPNPSVIPGYSSPYPELFIHDAEITWDTYYFTYIITGAYHHKQMWADYICTQSQAWCSAPIIWLSSSQTTIYCKWMSHNYTLCFGELLRLCIERTITVKQPLFSIVVDSCRSDHRAAPPKPRKVWITPSRRSKLAQWVVVLGTHTHTLSKISCCDSGVIHRLV